MHAFNNCELWPQVIPCIQPIINNTSLLLAKKRLNKTAYGFFLYRPLDFLIMFPTPNTLTTCANIAEAIFFTLLN